MTNDVAAAFQLLGLGVEADADAVRAAFRKMVSAVHPDVVGVAGSELTLALLGAYRTALLRTTESASREQAVAPSESPPDSSIDPTDTPPEGADVWLADTDTICLRCSREEAFARVLEVGHSLGSITYLDRESDLLEVLLRTRLGDTLSLVISFQGRNDWMEAFLTSEVLDTAKHELPSTAQITELYAHQLINRW